MNISRILKICAGIALLASISFAWGHEEPNKGKSDLPLCAASLPSRLLALGEQPFGYGAENSKLALQQGKPAVVFFLNPESGPWSFLFVTDNSKCFTAMGKQWHKTKDVDIDVRNVVAPKMMVVRSKWVGYSAPFDTLKAELLSEGKSLVGYGVQNIDLSSTMLKKLTTYLFVDRSGNFSAVTSQVNKSGHEMSSVDSTGSGWRFVKTYKSYRQ